MQPTSRNGAEHVEEVRLFHQHSSHSHEVAADLTARLEQSYVELAELKEALTANEQRSVAAKRKLEELTAANSRLRRGLIRLIHKEAKAHHFAYHDTLTGLPNRRLLLDRLSQAIRLAMRGHKQVAVLFFDLDRFKNINDSLGHASGDKILIQVAQRLSKCLRSADTACRYGGDEFVVVLPEIDAEESAGVVEQRIRAHLNMPYHVDNNAVIVAISMGVAVHPLDGRTSHDLIKQADRAMYRAKVCGDTVRETSYW